jgi:hypothetical protein
MDETAGQRRVVGAIWLLAAVVSIGAALALQPVGEWSIFVTILAVLIAILGLTGAWMLVTGKGRITKARSNVKAQRILSIVGLIGATVLVLTYVIGDWANWNAMDALSIGIWISIGAMFLQGLLITSKSS